MHEYPSNSVECLRLAENYFNARWQEGCFNDWYYHCWKQFTYYRNERRRLKLIELIEWHDNFKL